MQLKITRSQRETGVVSKTAVFCIYARVQFTAEERNSIVRYKLQNQVIYDSEAAKAMMARSEASRGSGINYSGSMVGMFGSAATNAFSGAKSLAYAAMAALKLRITIGSLERGQLVECKSLDELMEAFDAIMDACRNLKGYLDTAATFDGRETLYGFESGQPEVIASSATPDPMLIVEPVHGLLPSPDEALNSDGFAPAPQWNDTASLAPGDQYFEAGVLAQKGIKWIRANFFGSPVWLAAAIGVAIALYCYHWMTLPPPVPVE